MIWTACRFSMPAHREVAYPWQFDRPPKMLLGQMSTSPISDPARHLERNRSVLHCHHAASSFDAGGRRFVCAFGVLRLSIIPARSESGAAWGVLRRSTRRRYRPSGIQLRSSLTWRGPRTPLLLRSTRGQSGPVARLITRFDRCRVLRTLGLPRLILRRAGARWYSLRLAS
jgi:hypothetical protein